jgi:hypothetical protein
MIAHRGWSACGRGSRCTARPPRWRPGWRTAPPGGPIGIARPRPGAGREGVRVESGKHRVQSWGGWLAAAQAGGGDGALADRLGVAGGHAEPVAGEGLAQRRPGGAELGGGGVDAAELFGQLEGPFGLGPVTEEAAGLPAQRWGEAHPELGWIVSRWEDAEKPAAEQRHPRRHYRRSGGRAAARRRRERSAGRRGCVWGLTRPRVRVRHDGGPLPIPAKNLAGLVLGVLADLVRDLLTRLRGGRGPQPLGVLPGQLPPGEDVEVGGWWDCL